MVKSFILYNTFSFNSPFSVPNDTILCLPQCLLRRNHARSVQFHPKKVTRMEAICTEVLKIFIADVHEGKQRTGRFK